MCDACRECSKVWDGSQQLLVSRITNKLTGRPMLILVQNNDNPQSVQIEVKYCPWCGEYLMKEDE